MGDPDGSIWGQLVLIVVLTVINAFFAAAEIAVVSLNPSRLATQADKGDKKAAKLVAIRQNSANFLATIQVGITFAGFFASATAATTLADRLAPLFGQATWAHEVAVLLVTIALSYISLVFGELYPKQLALAKTEPLAKFAVTPISWLSAVMRPFVWFLSLSTKLLMALTPLKFDHQDNRMTRDEMVAVLQSGRQSGALDRDEYDMMAGVIGLDTKVAREVMVPRTDAFMIDADQPDAEAIDAILDQVYSRIPVYHGDKDHVIGIVHIKNLLKRARAVGFAHVRLEAVMTKPLFVPETISVDDLLTEMRVQHQQMAILLDEYGGVVGLVTIEDLIEEIVGDIDDESDRAAIPYTKLDEHTYLVSGRMTLSDFNDAFHTDLAADDVDTVAGFVISQLGVIPTSYKQEVLTLPSGMTMTTGKMEGSRLVNVHIQFPVAKSE
ncbi:MAG: hemolysin family protein [Lactobacillus sp.]|jgi:putative hemolysin|nr:hemolysin family protein [Lactobacillus sp.]MCI2031822.1 hemolysin family protein [Lactobacillus sp.]